MIVALTLLLTCQLIGEALARLLALPVPGPVIGLVLLFLGLRWRPSAALDGAPLATVACCSLISPCCSFRPEPGSSATPARYSPMVQAC